VDVTAEPAIVVEVRVVLMLSESVNDAEEESSSDEAVSVNVDFCVTVLPSESVVVYVLMAPD
jgi:hypothetical protein